MIEELIIDIKKYEELFIKNNSVKDKFSSGELEEADCCQYVWDNLYSKIYPEREFWKTTSFSKINVNTNRRKFIYYKDTRLQISGDLLYNFSCEGDGKKGRGKFEQFEEIIREEPEFNESEKKKYLELLTFCNTMTYTIHNMGLMLVNGSLQTIKENAIDKKDRLDSFVYLLADYYKCSDKDKHEIISKAGKLGGKVYKYSEEEKERKRNDNRQRVKDFLAEFDNNIYSYCEAMYLIPKQEDGKEYVDKLIKQGKEKITTGKDVVQYMELAIEYWKMKDEILKSKEIEGV